MSTTHHFSSNPTDPFQWRESVLSTRSISYVSTVDAPGSGSTRSRNASMSYAQTTPHHNTVSEDGLEMVGAMETRDSESGGLSAIHEIPASVARSLIFTLPREIRDHIYSFCLTTNDHFPVEWLPHSGSNVRLALQPQLLRTCRIIYEEAAPVLYSNTNLTIHHPSDANMFVRAIASPAHTRYISTLSLHIKAQDTRLWMPYLTSTDGSRSLKADFPNIKDLTVRYRSTKWHHASSNEQNMRAWAEDSRLDEIIDSLRHVFFPLPPGSVPESGRSRHNGRLDRAAWDERSNRPGNPVHDDSEPSAQRYRSASHKAGANVSAATATYGSPLIKITCACRIHPALFAGITGTGPMPALPAPAMGPPPPPPPPAIPGQQLVEMPSPIPPEPVVEGEPFRGFTIQDLNTVETNGSPDDESGIMKSARTPFANKDRILLAFEVYTLESSRSKAANSAASRGEHFTG